MMNDLVEHDLLDLMKDVDGNFYVPAYRYNGIPYWDLTQGYQVKVTQATTTTWTGSPIAFDADIPLTQGWNMIAYYPTYELPCEHPDYLPFSSILDYVEIAKDADGNFAVPAYGWSGMAPWFPTQGYQIKVTQDAVLNYPPDPQEGQLAVAEDEESIPSIVATPFNMSLLINALRGEFGEDAQVLAVSASGVTVGKGLIGEDGRCGLAVWGDDPATPETEGLREGEAFSLGLVGVDVVDVVDVVDILAGEGLVYETDAFTAVEAMVRPVLPDRYYIAEAYPNPFNSATRLTFGLPEAGWAKLAVYDLNGRLVETLVNSEIAAGVHSVQWVAEGLPSGLYLARLECNGQTAMRKLTLVK